MMRERLKYLDYIRAFSTILIVLTHYNALFLYLPGEPYTGNAIVLTAYVNGLYIGDWGVSLFLIISGAALMYTYQDSLDIKLFYKKRFLTIYPIYWVVYIIAMSYLFLKYKTINPANAESWKVLLSLLGIDSYLGSITTIWSCVGEWFLGLILLIYIIFPIIWYLMKKNEYVLWSIILIQYVVFLKYNPFQISPTTIIFVRLPEFCFGMWFIKHKDKILKSIPVIIIVAIFLLIFDCVFRSYINVSLRTTYLGILLFLFFVIISRYISNLNIVNNISSFICKYSYIIFLIHHRIIWEVTGNWDMRLITRFQSWILFFVILEISFIGAYWIMNVYSLLKTTFIGSEKNSHFAK